MRHPHFGFDNHGRRGRGGGSQALQLHQEHAERGLFVAADSGGRRSGGSNEEGCFRTLGGPFPASDPGASRILAHRYSRVRRQAHMEPPSPHRFHALHGSVGGCFSRPRGRHPSEQLGARGHLLGHSAAAGGPVHRMLVERMEGFLRRRLSRRRHRRSRDVLRFAQRVAHHELHHVQHRPRQQRSHLRGGRQPRLARNPRTRHQQLRLFRIRILRSRVRNGTPPGRSASFLHDQPAARHHVPVRLRRGQRQLPGRELWQGRIRR
mmetsp:Transcript_19857/g.56189  ORF Transcript_19857/g.56189 Transcript_19857/m.56189 type:complete len:264 (+) Transcript_19857:1069-1860(+)